MEPWNGDTIYGFRTRNAEIRRAVGLWPEQSRADRDQFELVTVAPADYTRGGKVTLASHAGSRCSRTAGWSRRARATACEPYRRAISAWGKGAPSLAT